MSEGVLLPKVVRRAPRLARPDAVSLGCLTGASADSGGQGAAGGGASGGGGRSQPGRARRRRGDPLPSGVFQPTYPSRGRRRIMPRTTCCAVAPHLRHAGCRRWRLPLASIGEQSVAGCGGVHHILDVGRLERTRGDPAAQRGRSTRTARRRAGWAASTRGSGPCTLDRLLDRTQLAGIARHCPTAWPELVGQRDDHAPARRLGHYAFPSACTGSPAAAIHTDAPGVRRFALSSAAAGWAPPTPVGSPGPTTCPRRPRPSDRRRSRTSPTARRKWSWRSPITANRPRCCASQSARSACTSC